MRARKDGSRGSVREARNFQVGESSKTGKRRRKFDKTDILHKQNVLKCNTLSADFFQASNAE